ncbi:hypothetical protein Scep_026201 [Stephania cephalantha]|uniref:Uncharacterized protein n=1 Tax=Stephania cephalantha TaxID=152367 RepID=A0AAP0EMW7_9MAGN
MRFISSQNLEGKQNDQQAMENSCGFGEGVEQGKDVHQLDLDGWRGGGCGDDSDQGRSGEGESTQRTAIQPEIRTEEWRRRDRGSQCGGEVRAKTESDDGGVRRSAAEAVSAADSAGGLAWRLRKQIGGSGGGGSSVAMAVARLGRSRGGGRAAESASEARGRAGEP